MSKTFLAVFIIAIGAVVGVFMITREEADTPSNGEASVSSHHKGAGESGVELVEYVDFQCGACKAYYPIVEEVFDHYGDDIKLTIRHFPLTQIHNHAMLAARAAEAASKQDKFWEYHDILFERQEIWSEMTNPNSTFEEYAEELGLDVEQFKSDRDSRAVANTINADLEQAREIGAAATPTFVLNGEKLEENPRSPAEFIELIDTEIAQAESN